MMPNHNGKLDSGECSRPASKVFLSGNQHSLTQEYQWWIISCPAVSRFQCLSRPLLWPIAVKALSAVLLTCLPQLFLSCLMFLESLSAWKPYSHLVFGDDLQFLVEFGAWALEMNLAQEVYFFLFFIHGWLVQAYVLLGCVGFLALVTKLSCTCQKYFSVLLYKGLPCFSEGKGHLIDTNSNKWSVCCKMFLSLCCQNLLVVALS